MAKTSKHIIKLKTMKDNLGAEPAKGETARGTKTSAVAYQEELKKDMILKNRTATPHTSAKTDEEDIGHASKPKGEAITAELDKGQPTREVPNPAHNFGKVNKGFNSSDEGRVPDMKRKA